jgi:hypothetical protein
MHGDAMKRNLKPMLVAAAALALGAAPLAADEDTQSRPFSVGASVSIAFPQDKAVSNSFGNAIGVRLGSERMVSKNWALCLNSEYMQYAGKTLAIAPVPAPIEVEAKAARLGVDFVHRQEGLLQGAFCSMGAGVTMVWENASAAWVGFSGNAVGPFFSLGMGYDFGCVGVEARYVKASHLEFESNGIKDYDDFSGFQVGIRYRVLVGKKGIQVF